MDVVFGGGGFGEVGIGGGWCVCGVVDCFGKGFGGF